MKRSSSYLTTASTPFPSGSGHEAGYLWAQDKGITDESDCGGSSESFVAGCVAFCKAQKGEGDDS